VHISELVVVVMGQDFSFHDRTTIETRVLISVSRRNALALEEKKGGNNQQHPTKQTPCRVCVCAGIRKKKCQLQNAVTTIFHTIFFAYQPFLSLPTSF
jgi:hypothetical protein